MSTIFLKPPIEVTEQEWAMVCEVLSRSARGRHVWAYGSRARRENVWTYSDLDLIVGGPSLTGAEAWRLEMDFDESRLPFRVQFQHLDSIDADFRNRIEKDFVPLEYAACPATA